MRKVFLIATLLVLAATTAVVPAFAQQCTEDAPCDITVWQIFSDQRLDWIVDTADRFNAEYPQYNVIIENPGDYFQILDQYTLAAESGEQPEIAQFFDAGLQFAADSGFFKPADEIIAGRNEVLGQEVNFDDIIPVIGRYYTIDGVWQSVPWNTSTAISYANMDILNSVGIEEVPATWDDLLALCEAVQPLVEAGELEGCAAWPFDNWFTEQWIAGMGGFLVDQENGRVGRATEVLLTSDEMLSIADFYTELYTNDYYVYTGTRRDWGGTRALFGQGEVAFALFSSASARGVTEDALASGFEVGTGKLIHNSDFEYNGNILGGATMWITDGLDPEVEEGAMAFLLYLNNTENSASHHTASGYVPIRQSSVDLLQSLEAGNEIFWDVQTNSRIDIEGSNWFEENPNFLTASTQLAESTVNNSSAGAKFGTFRETRDFIERAMEDIMLNGADPMATLEATKEEVDNLLEEYNLLYVE
jgi:sn-glycerol 3-phosphate transport system substrate-binding protein